MQNIARTMARVMAILGGIVLTALILMVCASILGRSGNTLGHLDTLAGAVPELSNMLKSVGPVPGDFEIVEAGIAFSIFAFLPLCQLRGGHATVDVFTSFLSAGTNRWIRAFWEVVLTVAILLITWRLGVGMMSKISTGETTLLLGFPKWWGFAASFVAALTASAVALFCAYARVSEAATGHALLENEGAAH